MSVLTTAQVARELGVSRQRVQVLIATGRLRAVRFGVAWMVAPADLTTVAVRRPGRPRRVQLKSATPQI